jgi:hypothetical protein
MNTLEQQLAVAKFKPSGNGQFRRSKLKLQTQDGWAALLGSPRGDDPLDKILGAPGLAKHQMVAGKLRRVIDLPLQRLIDGAEADAWPSDSEQQDHAGPATLGVEWAVATLAGKLDAGWQPPPTSEVDAWLDPHKLIFRSGAVVRQGELVCETGRLAVRLALAPRVPDDLPEARRAWLRDVLVAAAQRHRMVRIGLEQQHDFQRVVAEVDFSGAPHAILPPLVTTGVAALRCAVAWSIHSVDFLVDPNLACRSLEVHSHPIGA